MVQFFEVLQHICAFKATNRSTEEDTQLKVISYNFTHKNMSLKVYYFCGYTCKQGSVTPETVLMEVAPSQRRAAVIMLLFNHSVKVAYLQIIYNTVVLNMYFAVINAAYLFRCPLTAHFKNCL
jgi:hypothetical protein